MTLDLPKLKAGDRDLSGETVGGMRVRAWVWESPLPVTEGSQTYECYAHHWSTGPKGAERLFGEDDVAKLLARIETAERWMARTMLLVHTMVGDGIFFTEEEEPSDLWFEGMAILGLDPDFVDETKHRADLIARSLLTPPGEG